MDYVFGLTQARLNEDGTISEGELTLIVISARTHGNAINGVNMFDQFIIDPEISDYRSHKS